LPSLISKVVNHSIDLLYHSGRQNLDLNADLDIGRWSCSYSITQVATY
jgi:hypothetical protein